MTSMCDRCYAPGECCKRLTVNRTFWDDEPIGPQLEALKEANPGNASLPWLPVKKRSPSFVSEDEETKGRKYSYWLFECPWLTAEGRCGNYEQRPEVCRIFEPGSDGICVHYQGAENSELFDIIKPIDLTRLE